MESTSMNISVASCAQIARVSNRTEPDDAIDFISSPHWDAAKAASAADTTQRRTSTCSIDACWMCMRDPYFSFELIG